MTLKIICKCKYFTVTVALTSYNNTGQTNAVAYFASATVTKREKISWSVFNPVLHKSDVYNQNKGAYYCTDGFQNCPYFNDDSGDYENVTTSTTTHRKPVDANPRSFSPPRSSNSSGYGTGSSRKSIGDQLLINQVSTL